MAKLGVVIVARLLDLALQGLVGHLARGIAVVSNPARCRSVGEGALSGCCLELSLMRLKMEGMMSEMVGYTPLGASSTASHAPQAKTSVGGSCRGDSFGGQAALPRGKYFKKCFNVENALTKFVVWKSVC